MSAAWTVPADALERELDALVAKPRLQHAVMGLATRDRSFAWSGARGTAAPDGAPMTAHTPFHIASIDKLLTAIVTLRLTELGEVSLDDRLVDWLPGRLVSGIHRMGGVDRTDEIRLAHLLGHTSGLPDNLEDAPKGGRSVMEELFDGEDRALETVELIEATRRLPAHFAPQPLDAPRVRVRYSDTNFQLLILVAEHATGRPVHELFAEWVFQPLGMRQTWVLGRTEPAEKTPRPASVWFGDTALDLPIALESMLSVYSTADDLITLIEGIVSGGVFERPATYPLMTSRFNRFGFPSDKASLRAPSWPIEYGYGLMRFKLPRLFTGGRDLPAVVGHTGSTGTWLFHSPELGVSFAGAVDEVTSGAVPYRLAPRVLRLIADSRSG